MAVARESVLVLAGAKSSVLHARSEDNIASFSEKNKEQKKNINAADQTHTHHPLEIVTCVLFWCDREGLACSFIQDALSRASSSDGLHIELYQSKFNQYTFAGRYASGRITIFLRCSFAPQNTARQPAFARRRGCNASTAKNAIVLVTARSAIIMEARSRASSWEMEYI